jgi:hypothetical protein
VRVIRGDRETVFSLTLPDLAEATWQVPAGVRRGVPKPSEEGGSTPEIWPWLAVAGGLGLLLDWLFFGRSRMFRLRPRLAVAHASRTAVIGSLLRRRPARKAS